MSETYNAESIRILTAKEVGETQPWIAAETLAQDYAQDVAFVRRLIDACLVSGWDLTRAIALDGKCLRGKKEKDHKLGYKLMSRFAQVIEEDLQATRLQLIDLYQNPAEMKSR